MASRTVVPGVLLLYEDYFRPDAATIHENLQAFSRYSRFPIYPLNVSLGFPRALNEYEFSVCVFHYSLRPTYHWLGQDLAQYLRSCENTYKVAIFQDEIWYFKERLAFLNDYRIDCLFSRHKPWHVRDIYPPEVPVKRYVHYLAGYVAPEMVETAQRLARPLSQRPIDVGYRGRKLPYYFGKGGQEKGLIGERFRELTRGSGLVVDIETEETKRLYGDSWPTFLAACKALLGVEGGVSVVDTTEKYSREYPRLIEKRPHLTFAEYAAEMGEDFARLEDRIDYRSLTPRHFEAAAFGNVQILFEGAYDGLIQPHRHYIPLRKDFTNLAEVLQVLASEEKRAEIANNAYRDLIASGRYSYASFIQSFDAVLVEEGVREQPSSAQLQSQLKAYLEDWSGFRRAVEDFDRVLQVEFATRPEIEVRVNINLAQAMLKAYIPEVEGRQIREYTPVARWVARSRDRECWRKLGRIAPFPIPRREELMHPPGVRSSMDWLVSTVWGLVRSPKRQAG